MAFSETLRLILDADTRGAVRGIQQVGATTQRELSRSQKSLDQWGRGLTTAGATMVALGGAALFGLGKAAMASEDAHLSVVKLENTLARMPRLAGENSKSFIDLANSIQGKTAADADQIVEAEALLGTFNLTGREIRSIVPLVVDLSRKFGINMSSAAIQVGKALDGNIGALKRNGISIDETAFATDRYAAVQKALAEQVGGFSEAEGATFAGSLERLKHQLGDVAEGVGVGAVDAFSSMFGVVEGLTDRLNDLSPATQSTIGKVATFGSVALVTAGGLSFMIGQLITMRRNFLLAQESVIAFAGSGGLGRLARAGLVVGGLIAIREVLLALEDDLEGIDVSTLENELLDLAEKGKFTGGQLEDVFEGFADAVESGDPQKIEAIADQLGEVDKALAQLAARDPEAAAAAFGFITDRLTDLGASRGQIKGFFDDYSAAVAAADTASRTAAGGAEELGGAFGDQAGEVSGAQQALEDYLDTLSGLFDPLFSATDALMDNQAAQQAVRVAELELAAAQRDHGKSSAEATEAQQKLTEAQIAAGKSALDVKQATAELSTAVEEGTVSVADAKSMLASWVTQGLISKSTASALSAQFEDTADAAETLGRTDPNVRVTETGNRPTQTQLRRTRNEAFGIPARRNTNVTATGTNTARIRILQVRDALGQLHNKTLTIGVTTALSGQAVAIMNNKMFRAAGGPVQSGMPYVVGEKGPEWFVPKTDGMIFPNGAMPGGGGSGTMVGGGTVINLDMRGAVVADDAQFERMVVRAFQNAGDHARPITVRGRRIA